MIKKAVRNIILMPICILISLCLYSDIGANRLLPNEYSIKAAFLYNFAKFIEWPEKDFPNSNTPLTIYILGNDPFGNIIESISSKSINGRKIVVRGLTNPEHLEFCHMLFICKSEEVRLPQILETIKGSSIVTVSDIEGFASEGGLIGFYTSENMIRFEMNMRVALESGLKISSRLLKLARIINDEPITGE